MWLTCRLVECSLSLSNEDEDEHSDDGDGDGEDEDNEYNNEDYAMIKIMKIKNKKFKNFKIRTFLKKNRPNVDPKWLKDPFLIQTQVLKKGPK